MSGWNYEDLENDMEELNQNLLYLNKKNMLKAEQLKIKEGKKVDKAEKRLGKTISKLFKR